MNTIAQSACPCCNPSCPELDEDGIPFTCYFCCDTGLVDKAVADAYWQAQDDAAEYGNLSPVVNGKHIVQRCDEYEAWEETRTLLPAAVFIPAARAGAQVWRAALVNLDADLPF